MTSVQTRNAPGLAAPSGSRAGWVSPRRAFWLVAGALAVTMLGTTLPTPLYDLYERSLGLAPLMITIIFAVYAVGVLAALVLFGRASDQLGRRRLLLFALACAVLSAGAFLLADGLPLLFAGRVLSGLSAGIFTGTATATLVDLAGEGRGPRASLVATASNMGGLGLGPLLAGLLAQFAPQPLRLPFWVDLGLVLLAVAAVWPIPETVSLPAHPHLRIRRPGLPAQVRPVFTGAAIATFTGGAVLAAFTAVAPTFLLELLDEGSPLLAGAVVFTLFAASALGQILLTRRLGRRALVTGCVLLVIGLGLLAAALAAASLALMIAAAIVAGLGQGLTLSAGLAAVTAAAPSARRADVASSFFIVFYLGIAIPVVGVGVAATFLGLRTAGIAFTVVVAVVAMLASAVLARTAAGRPQLDPRGVRLGS
ncbi:MAG: Transporter, major facilitator family protein [Frankiales bacterium]|nr:Transporter, major facilitator family protein [Frankiales bacterium]